MQDALHRPPVDAGMRGMLGASAVGERVTIAGSIDMSTSQSPELMGGNLFGERDFAGVTRAVEMDSFWIIQVSLNPMTSVLVRDREGTT